METVTFDFEQFRVLRENAMGRLVWRLKRYMDGFTEPRLHARGFTDFKLSYLTFLANIEENGTTNREMARKARVTKQMMSKVIGLLEQEGYIYTRKHETDSRSSVIFLSERGKELLLAVNECMNEARAKFDAIVGAERMDQLRTTLRDLVDELEKEEGE